MTESPRRISEFERLRDQNQSMGLLTEIWAFLRHRKKFWLLPIIAVLLLFGLMMVLTGTAAAPFIYTLF